MGASPGELAVHRQDLGTLRDRGRLVRLAILDQPEDAALPVDAFVQFFSEGGHAPQETQGGKETGIVGRECDPVRSLSDPLEPLDLEHVAPGSCDRMEPIGRAGGKSQQENRGQDRI